MVIYVLYTFSMINRKFKKEDVIKAFGTVTHVAEFFDTSTQAVSNWAAGKPIPKARIYELVARRPDLCSKPYLFIGQ